MRCAEYSEYLYEIAPEIKVKTPECVEMFDRTRLPARTDIRKFYFRGLGPAKSADIVFAHPDGDIMVSVEIWSFDATLVLAFLTRLLERRGRIEDALRQVTNHRRMLERRLPPAWLRTLPLEVRLARKIGRGDWREIVEKHLGLRPVHSDSLAVVYRVP